MHEVFQTREFERWHRSLRDSRAVARVTTAIERLQLGLLGDYKSVGDGVSEIRISWLPAVLHHARQSTCHSAVWGEQIEPETGYFASEEVKGRIRSLRH